MDAVGFIVIFFGGFSFGTDIVSVEKVNGVSSHQKSSIRY